MKSIVVAALFSLLIARSADADVITFSTSDSRFDNNVNNQGWWSNISNNFDSNDNYITGFTNFGIITFGGPTEWRSFFTFDLSTLDLTGQVLLSATLEVVRSLYDSSDPTETIAFFDVSTNAATLNNNFGMNTAIFNDLGSGATYGSFVVPAYSESSTEALAFLLNTAALADIASAAGGFFSIGGALQSFSNDGRPQAEALFGFSMGTTQSLTLEVAPATAVPEPGSFFLFGAGAAVVVATAQSRVGRYRRQRRRR
jgi:PEP-CTERM motif